MLYPYLDVFFLLKTAYLRMHSKSDVSSLPLSQSFASCPVVPCPRTLSRKENAWQVSVSPQFIGRHRSSSSFAPPRLTSLVEKQILKLCSVTTYAQINTSAMRRDGQRSGHLASGMATAPAGRKWMDSIAPGVAVISIPSLYKGLAICLDLVCSLHPASSVPNSLCYSSPYKTVDHHHQDSLQDNSN